MGTVSHSPDGLTFCLIISGFCPVVSRTNSESRVRFLGDTLPSLYGTFHAPIDCMWFIKAYDQYPHVMMKVIEVDFSTGKSNKFV